MASLICKTVKGNKYWYIVESKRVNGKVRQVVVEYIGNQKKLSERILGINSNKEVSSFGNITIKSFSHGDSFALLQMAQKLGISEILDNLLPSRKRDGVKRSTSLLLAAIHRVASPGSKRNFSQWFERTSIPWQMEIRPQVMTSQHFWDQMDDITEEDLRLAEDTITKKILEVYDVGLEKLALDYTNYFTFIDSSNHRNNLAQRGRNKQKRHDLRQCSLAIVTSKECNIPLFSHVYKGNRNDHTEFAEYAKMLRERMPSYNPECTTLIFDGGSNTKKNLEMLEMHYICSFSLSFCKELYEIELSEYEEIELENKTVEAHRSTREIWGSNRECILTFSQALYQGQMLELEGDIKKTICDLDELNQKIKNPKSHIDKSEKKLGERARNLLRRRYMKDIFHVSVEKEGILYIPNEKKKQEIIEKYFGKKLTITDHFDWTTEEILSSYYEQDCIEKLFRDTKNTEHFSLRPIYHWTDQKIRVHAFICLLGLTLTALLQKEVMENGVHLSKNQLLEELSGIRESWVMENDGENSNKKVIKILEKMNPTQSELWNIILKI